MNSIKGVKVVSTLLFHGAAGLTLRYEILADLDHPGVFGFHVYIFALVEGLNRESPVDVSRMDAPKTKKAKAWLFAEGHTLEGLVDLNAAEIAAQEHFAQNHMMMRMRYSPLV